MTAAVQTIGGIVGQQGPWWIWFFVYAVFGWAASTWAVFTASRICPNPKIGSYMFLGLFIVAELIGFVRASLQDLRLRILFTGGD